MRLLDGAKRLPWTRILVVTALVAAPVLTPIASYAQVNGSNSSDNSSASSGDANGTNNASGQTGQSSSNNNNVNSQDTKNSNGTNVQDGNNRTNISQTTNVKTGDVVVGQVIGGVVAGGGNLVVNATNHSNNVDATSGDANGTNNASVATGLISSSAGAAFVGDALGDPNASTSDLNNVVGRNVQDGDNTTNARQNTNVQTGDAIGGQVIGAVVNGGTTDIAAANTTQDSDITTGDGHAENSLAAFTGLLATTGTAAVGPGGLAASDIAGATGTNIQSGDNRFNANQNAVSQTGDGVAGQVLGVVSAGATRVDASNTTTDSSVTSGDSDARNSGAAFTGLLDAGTATVSDADLSGVSGANLQDGSNTGRLNQSANAVSGDGVAGQVAGIVTSAGGSAAVTLANTSTDVDSTSGDTNFSNDSSMFNGLGFTTGTASVGGTADTALSGIFKSALT
jgi:hypothetical protein